MGRLAIDMQMRGLRGSRGRLDLDRELIYLVATDTHARLNRLKKHLLN